MIRGRGTAPALTAALVSGLLLGCGNGKTEQAADTAGMQETASPAEDDAGVAAQPARIQVPEAAEPIETASVDLEGTLGCGHCNFHVKNECSLAMQAADGEIYLLDAGDGQDALMEARLDQPAVKVTGRVAEVEDRKVIYTDSVELR